MSRSGSNSHDVSLNAGSIVLPAKWTRTMLVHCRRSCRPQLLVDQVPRWNLKSITLPVIDFHPPCRRDANAGCDSLWIILIRSSAAELPNGLFARSTPQMKRTAHFEPFVFARGKKFRSGNSFSPRPAYSESRPTRGIQGEMRPETHGSHEITRGFQSVRRCCGHEGEPVRGKFLEGLGSAGTPAEWKSLFRAVGSPCWWGTERPTTWLRELMVDRLVTR